MEEKKRRGRPPKSAAPAIVPETKITTKAAKKYPLNPDPDLSVIRKLVIDGYVHANQPVEPNDFLGAQYLERFGYLKHVLDLLADELGVMAG